jgi:hypothetical protein
MEKNMTYVENVFYGVTLFLLSTAVETSYADYSDIEKIVMDRTFLCSTIEKAHETWQQPYSIDFTKDDDRIMLSVGHRSSSTDSSEPPTYIIYYISVENRTIVGHPISLHSRRRQIKSNISIENKGSIIFKEDFDGHAGGMSRCVLVEENQA